MRGELAAFHPPSGDGVGPTKNIENNPMQRRPAALPVRARARRALRVAEGAELMFCVPLRAGPAHVIELGPIGIADGADQMMASRDDHDHAPGQLHP